MDCCLCFDGEFSLPPTANILFQTALRKNKRWTYLSKEGRDFRNHVLKKLKCYDFEKIDNVYKIFIDVSFIFNTERKQDVDNRIKALLDALTVGEVWHDDSQVYKMKVQKIVDKKTNSRTEIKVYKYL